MKKADVTTKRESLASFEQIINIGPSLAEDFRLLGLASPTELIGNDPVQLYQELCQITNKFHDPCVLDCFLAAVDYMDGKPPQVWWNFTSHRKEQYSQVVSRLREQYASAPATSNQ